MKTRIHVNGHNLRANKGFEDGMESRAVKYDAA